MKNQKGFSLIFVIVILLVVSFIVASSFRMLNSEMSQAAGDADKKFAFNFNEATLDYIEKIKLPSINKQIKDGSLTLIEGQCVNGICRSINTALWEKNSISGKNILDDCTTSGEFIVNNSGGSCTKSGNITWRNPHYIIELLTEPTASVKIYRVTVKSWGKDENSTAVTQAYYKDEL